MHCRDVAEALDPGPDGDVTEHGPSAERPLDGGGFSAWLTGMQAALRGERDSDVPCGECTACCTSSQFIHIAPDEIETLRRIPRALWFPAPRRPPGHMVLGYDERGHCPMFVEGACSIYEHRPRTCRTYDCRVFVAADVVPDDKPLIAAQVRRWQFSYPDAGDERRHLAVRAAAQQVRADAVATGGAALISATQLAVSVVDTANPRTPAREAG
jgi:uncharacterized protein